MTQKKKRYGKKTLGQIKSMIKTRQKARKLLRDAEASHAKAGKGIKLLRKSLKKRGYL